MSSSNSTRVLSHPPPPDATRPSIHACAGRVTLGAQVVTHGLDVHHDCIDMTFVSFLLFSVTGRKHDERCVRVLEQLWITTGYADARIWSNRVAAYLGSARVDPALAMSASLAASDGLTTGFRAMSAAYGVQAHLPEEESERTAWLAARLESGGMVHGYARAIHGHDERIGAALAILARAGFRAGPALTRAFLVDRELRAARGVEMNITGLWAALCIDFGIDQREYEAFMLLMFTPGHAAVYADQRKRTPFSFLRGHRTGTGTGA